MATPKAPILSPYPAPYNVPRLQGLANGPPHVIPKPSPLSQFKATLPNLPSAFQLFHKPRQSGN